MKMLIELDFLIALIRSGDRHHREVVGILEEKRGELALSPYSLLELDLLLWSNRLKVRERGRFLILLDETLKYYLVEVLRPSPRHLSEAYKLRGSGLTFFDSLHAATALSEHIPLLSYDRSYEKVGELRYIHPSTLIDSPI